MEIAKAVVPSVQHGAATESDPAGVSSESTATSPPTVLIDDSTSPPPPPPLSVSTAPHAEQHNAENEGFLNSGRSTPPPPSPSDKCLSPTAAESSPLRPRPQSWTPPRSAVASAAESTDHTLVADRVRKTRSFSQASVSSEHSRLSYFTLQGSTVGEDGYAPGAVFEYYKGDFASLPDFNTLGSYNAGVAQTIEIKPGTEAEVFDLNLQKGRSSEVGNFAVRYTAQLKIPTAGNWTFYLGANDGAALYISGRKVIDNDGSHYYKELQGTIKISKPGYYPITVTFFHRNGKMMEGVRASACLTLSYYFPGTGWTTFASSDKVAKMPIPEEALVHNARDERVALILDQNRALTWDLPDAIESEKLQLANLQQDLHDMSEKLVAVQRALAKERAQSQNLIRLLTKVPLFGPSLGNDHFLLSDHTRDSDEAYEDVHGKQLAFVQEHEREVARLRTGYFFSLGVQLKLLTKQNNFSVQDAYERCLSEKIPVQDWPNYLRKVMSAAAFASVVRTDHAAPLH
ncbi:hypothetical protein HDU86_006884 [Geranomyces michiganensis]|nr:hypothetical protein HDU86_006884 [Geranomyces michiganensis]